ncbi:MAG TPA: RidA family protein [Hellea balneolensis]|uniref:RidA family protein n=1 Tax=Hellea balneolensis TaxID=287478 RepID=A0A7C3G8H9_9PROT|nr:RidA family protein [Hellea balneolensis]
MRKTLRPEGWPRPKGYSNGIVCEGRMVFTAGVIGWDANEKFANEDLVDQLKQALINTKAVLAEAGAPPADIVRMTWYVTDMATYRSSQKEIGLAWREVLGKTFPCMACVEVTSLVEAKAKIEIETTAVLPNTEH